MSTTPSSSPNAPVKRTIGVLIYPDVEVLDFCGPYEVFSTARLDESMRRETESPITLKLVSQTTSPVPASGGMRVLPDVDFTNCPKLDVLMIPGGHGTRTLMHQEPYLNWIRQQAGQVDRIASIATGSLLLAAAGLLTGRSVTTHWRSVDAFRERFPSTTLLHELSIVVDGNIISASSIRAGLDLSLQLVAQYYGQPVARNAARQMDYRYPEGDANRNRNVQ